MARSPWRSALWPAYWPIRSRGPRGKGRSVRRSAERKQMEEQERSDQSRVGVYVCHCGSSIAGVVDCADVAAYGETLPDVIVSRHEGYLCSEPGQNQIK